MTAQMMWPPTTLRGCPKGDVGVEKRISATAEKCVTSAYLRFLRNPDSQEEGECVTTRNAVFDGEGAVRAQGGEGAGVEAEARTWYMRCCVRSRPPRRR